jgi:hypothetical protein
LPWAGVKQVAAAVTVVEGLVLFAPVDLSLDCFSLAT